MFVTVQNQWKSPRSWISSVDKKIAEKYSLTGWVKNCDDSSVECEISEI